MPPANNKAPDPLAEDEAPPMPPAGEEASDVPPADTPARPAKKQKKAPAQVGVFNLLQQLHTQLLDKFHLQEKPSKSLRDVLDDLTPLVPMGLQLPADELLDKKCFACTPLIDIFP